MISQTSAGFVEVAGNGGSPNGWDPRTWGLQPESSVMSITIQLDLPDALVNEARNNGLLESASVGDLLVTELRRRKAATVLKNVLEGIRRQPGEAMSEEEITAEVKAARRERQAREAGR